jgi:hypothetical protein
MEVTVQAGTAQSTAATRIALMLICAVACALFVFGAIHFYFGPAFAFYFSSDSAVPVLLANEVLRTGHLLPTTWYFANDEIWTLSPHLFVLPFVAALGMSTLALKLGNLLCLGAMIGLLALPLHRITRSWPYSILVAAGVLAAFSRYQELTIYGQTAYGWFCAQFALLIYLALRMQDESATAPSGLRSWTAAVYALFLVNLSIDSPLRTAVYWVAPVIAVALVFPPSKSRARALAAWTLLAFAVGFALHRLISGHVLGQAGTTSSLMGPIGNWGASLAIVGSGTAKVIADLWPWKATPFDALGVLRYCFFAIAAVVVLFAAVGHGPGSGECRFFARVSGAMLLSVLAVLTVGHLAVDGGSARYLVPPALLCLAALMAILWCRLGTSTYGITAIAALFVLAFCGGAAVLVSSQGPIAFDRDCDAPTGICRLVSELAKTGVNHGYATYWKSNVTTVASKGAITACGVVLAPHLAPFRWLVSKDCFDPSIGDRYFLALTQPEIASVGRAFLIAEAGAPDQIVTADEYEIWIYGSTTAKSDWLRP